MTASPLAPHPRLDGSAPTTVDAVGRRTVVRVTGEIDMATPPHLHAPPAARRPVICPAGRVRRLFDVAGVSSRLPIFDDRAAAHLAS